MPAGLRHLVGAAAAVFFVVLALPAGALAHTCNASACKVYVEQGAPNAGRGPGPISSGPVDAKQQGNLPKNLKRVLAQAGTDKAPLSQLLTESGGTGTLAGVDNAAGPGLLGAVLDLGAGPLALLGILVVTALGLASRRMRGLLRGNFSASDS